MKNTSSLVNTTSFLQSQLQIFHFAPAIPSLDHPNSPNNSTTPAQFLHPNNLCHNAPSISSVSCWRNRILFFLTPHFTKKKRFCTLTSHYWWFSSIHERTIVTCNLCRGRNWDRTCQEDHEMLNLSHLELSDSIQGEISFLNPRPIWAEATGILSV